LNKSRNGGGAELGRLEEEISRMREEMSGLEKENQKYLKMIVKNSKGRLV
jgi:hypothetical protein